MSNILDLLFQKKVVVFFSSKCLERKVSFKLIALVSGVDPQEEFTYPHLKFPSRSLRNTSPPKTRGIAGRMGGLPKKLANQ